MSGRVIFHIDINAFFASAEQLKNPALKNKPIAVASMNRRSVVTTASYEARVYGVHSAMPLMLAKEKCADLIVVEGDYAYYEEISARFFAFLKTFTTKIEIASIDECYMDVTEIIKSFKRPLDLAWMIQKQVYDKIGLSVSIGVAPNKFLAKMASDMKKPMGITVLRKSEIAKKLWVLPIEDMWGIGKKSIPMLKNNGIETIGDLVKKENEAFILKHLGKQGYWAIQNALGNGSNQLSYNHSVKSLSQSTTLDHDTQDYDEVKSTFKHLAIRLSSRLKESNMKGILLSISIRYNDFSNSVRSMNLLNYTNDVSEMLEGALLLFDQNYNQSPIRHLGISMGSFQNMAIQQQQLNFSKATVEQVNDIQYIIKELNQTIPNAKLTTASKLLNK